MVDQQVASRPQIRISVIICVAFALLNIFLGFMHLFRGVPGATATTILRISGIVELSLGIFFLISVRLIRKFRRAGLRLGLFTAGLTLVLYLLSLSSNPLSCLNGVPMMAMLVLLGYLYVYYTQEPCKSFFS